MIPIRGVVRVDEDHEIMYVETSNDILEYYLWFIRREYWIDLGTPMRGAHVTIASKEWHGVDWKIAKRLYDGKMVDMEYSPDIVRGGYTKGFIMFYLKVRSQDIEDIKKELGIIDGERYRGLHLTVANSKNRPVKEYWPKMIEI